MKAAVVLALVASAAAAPVPVAPGLGCAIPSKYAARNGDACMGPATGYVVNMFCKSAYEEDLDGILPSTTTYTLDTATAAQWTSNAPIAVKGCVVPSTENTATAAGGFVQDRVDPTLACNADAAQAPFLNAAVGDSVIKGATITCDSNNYYFPTNGIEGSMFCQGGSTGPAGAAWNLAPPIPTAAYWQTGFGNEFNVAHWSDDANNNQPDLTCAAACTIPEPLCYTDAATGVSRFHANVIADGPSKVYTPGANPRMTCRMAPSRAVLPVPANGVPVQSQSTNAVSRMSFRCKSNPETEYVATCNANTADGSISNGISWVGNVAPPCGGPDGASTGFFTLPQNTPGQQLADTIPGFDSVTSAITTTLTSAVAGQWGGLVRQYEPFATGSTYQVAVDGCAGAGNRADCVQKTVNWWRCEGLTIDASGVCYADAVRIACPTHTNGHRCPSSSSKKGLLGLLGLIALCPLLLLCLLCCCCLLPLLFRRKKTEGDVHFATFDPAAAPIGGSIAPATACYAPSIGACPAPVMGAPVPGVF